jgi:hypothetical protein
MAPSRHCGVMTYHAFVLTFVGALLVGCAGATPGNPGPTAQGGRQNCAACMEENPGNVVVCERICHEHLGDTASPWAGSVLR